MKRRDFIKRAAAVGVASALPFTGHGSQTGLQATSAKQQFDRALAKYPELIGFANTEQNFSNQSLKVEGVLPRALQGAFVRNGPARHERNEMRYHHLFEGDGMVQRFNFNNGNIEHMGRFVETPKYVREQQAQRFLYPGPETKFAGSLPVSKADQINPANTNVIPVNGELWALWEAGSASALDMQDLSFKRFVHIGEDSAMSDSLEGLPFSAHPKIDANGDIFNFGLNETGHIVIYRLSKTGALKNIKLLDAHYRGGILHDFLITERHILIVLPSLVRDRSKSGMFSSLVFDDQQPMQALVLDKNTLDFEKRYDLPPGFVFHFGNAWVDKSGDIHFDASVYNDAAVLSEFTSLMSGALADMNAHAHTVLFTLHKNGGVSHHAFVDVSEFPRVCPQLTGRQNRYLFHVSGDEGSLWSSSIVALDLISEKQQKFEFGRDFLVEEHIPVCPTNEEKGYLIGTALHVPSKRTCLNVFDLQNIESGPMARAWLPYHLPLGFHGNFVAA